MRLIQAKVLRSLRFRREHRNSFFHATRIAFLSQNVVLTLQLPHVFVRR